MNVLLSTSKAAAFFGVSNRTIYRWCDDGKLQFHFTPSGQRRISVSNSSPDLRYSRTPPRQTDTRESICYCRVSTYKQEDDLERQRNCMAEQFPGYRIVTDIGSGLNFKR